MQRTSAFSAVMVLVGLVACAPSPSTEIVSEPPALTEETAGEASATEAQATDAPATAAPATPLPDEGDTPEPESIASEPGAEPPSDAPDHESDAGTTSPTTGGIEQVQIFLVAIGDEGATGTEIGCGDSVIGVTRDIAPTMAPLSAAFETLLSLESRDYGESGFITALHGSDLAFAKAAIEAGLATVDLSGELVLAGVCDAPRVKAQLEETALQFDTVDSVEITVDGVPLDDLLSER